ARSPSVRSPARPRQQMSSRLPGASQQARRRVTCRLLSYSPEGASELLASLWNRLAVIPRAEAAAPPGGLVHLGQFPCRHRSYMKGDAGQELYTFTLLGVTIEFFFGNTAG